MAGRFKADEIAGYIRDLLDGQKALRDEVAVLKRQQRNVFGPPPVPFAGMFPALDPQHHDVVKIYYSKAEDNYWEGQLCKPIENAPFWEPDTDLGTISGVTPDMVSVPEVDELVEVFFSGMYDGGSDLASQYGMFNVADARPGLTTASQYPYPQDPATNVYEVQTLKARFPKQPGRQDYTGENKDVVVAMNWVDNPVLLPQGTKVTVHRHNGQWWFRQRSNTPSSCVCTPGSCTITVVVTAYGHLNCCSPTYAQTCTYTNTYTSVSTCSTGYDVFLGVYVVSCTLLTSTVTITSCTTVDIGGADINFTASYSFSSGCR